MGEDSLDGNIHGGHVEGLEHDLGHLLTVSLGVEGSLSKEDGLFLRGNTELIVEGVVPDLFHTDHHTLVARTANNGGEDSSGSVISSKSSLAHAGAIVNDKSSNVFVTHLIL